LLLRVWRAPGAAASEQGSVDGSPRPRAADAGHWDRAATRMRALGQQVSRARCHSLEKANPYRSAEQLLGHLGYMATPELTASREWQLKLATSLMDKGFVREVRAKPGMPAWRRNEDGRTYALVITKLGRAAIRVAEGRTHMDAVKDVGFPAHAPTKASDQLHPLPTARTPWLPAHRTKVLHASGMRHALNRPALHRKARNAPVRASTRLGGAPSSRAWGTAAWM
jgi:hypothetical protein